MCCWLGAYVCLLPRFELELYCRLMQDRRATLARIVPAVVKLLAEQEVVTRFRYPDLEYFRLFDCSVACMFSLLLFTFVCLFNANYVQDQTAAKLHEAFPGVALCQT